MATTKSAKAKTKTTPKKTTSKKAAVKKTTVKAAAKPSTKTVKSTVGKSSKKKCPFSFTKAIIPAAAFVAVVAIAIFAIVTFILKEHSMTCTKDSDENGKNHTISVVAIFKDKAVSEINTSMIFNSDEDAKIFCDSYSLLPGIADSVKCEGNEIKFKDSDLVLNNFEGAGLSRDEFASSVEKLGYTCKK